MKRAKAPPKPRLADLATTSSGFRLRLVAIDAEVDCTNAADVVALIRELGRS